MQKIHCLLFFLSFTAFAAAQSHKELKSAMEDSRDQKYDIFIETNDGKIIKFEKLKIKAAVLGYEHFEGDGKKLDISFDSVKAYQTAESYAYRIDSTPVIHLGKMPASSLFANRIRNGKIELFMGYGQMKNLLGVYSGEKETVYYIRKGKNSTPVRMTKEKLKTMISDKKAVLEEFDDLYKKRNLYDSATAIIDEYN